VPAMRKCRFCEKEIQDSSVVCEHCGRELIPGRALSNQFGAQVKKPVTVTTGDLKRDYEVIGPVYFQVSNKGIFSSSLSKLVNKYSTDIADAKKHGQVGPARSDWGFLYGEWSVGQSDFEKAFFVAVQELKKRATILGADAVIGMRQDIDLDTTSFQYFYLQMYGTAVRFT
jgi:hypothetical protein